MTRISRVARMAIVTMCVVVGSLVVGMSPAQAADPSVTLRPGGALHARGAAIVVEATVTCPAGLVAGVDVRATQVRADGSLVRGQGARAVSCTGAAITRRIAVSSADLRINGLTSAPPFTAGAVFATASFSFCDEIRCITATNSRTVQAANVLLDAARFSSSTLVVTLPAQGSVEAAGGGVIVRVPYRCAAGLTASFNAVLVERTSAAAVTSAAANEQVPCSGLDRTRILAFHAEAAAWRTGSAFVVLGGDVCGTQGCRPVYAHRTLTLV